MYAFRVESDQTDFRAMPSELRGILIAEQAELHHYLFVFCFSNFEGINGGSFHIKACMT